MMNAEHGTFLRAICAEPEDDLRRLVFADYLEESGEPAWIARAEFIRTQIELHNGQLTQEEHERFSQKARMLRGQFLDELDQILAQRPDWVVRASSYKGFPYRLETNLSTCRILGQTSLSDFAPIQSVQITGYASPQPEEPDPRAIRLFDQNNVRFVMIVSPKPRYPNLLSASLLNIPRLLTGRVVAEFLQENHLPKLQHLKIQGEDLQVADLMELMTQLEQTSIVSTLRELDLSEHPWEDDAGYFLCSGRAFQGLAKLRLKGHRFSPETQELLRRHFGDCVIL